MTAAIPMVLFAHTVSLAHAVLIRATPPTTQSLAQSPDQVQLLFSEPIDPVFSTVHVTDAAGSPVDQGDSHVDPTNDRLLVASLRPKLPQGVYTVNWRSLSTIDVHPDGGRYSLFVGVPVRPEVVTAAVLSNQNSSTPETTLGRWWFYLAASVFGGSLAVWKLAVAPALGTEAERMRGRVRRLVLIGGVLLLVGTLFAALAQAAAAADVPLLSAFGQPVADLLGRGRFASIWWPRFGIEVAAVALIALVGLEGTASESALAMVPAILLTSSLTSHGAALPALAGVGIAVDWLHVLGAAVWVGGLVLLLVLAPALTGSSPPLLPAVMRRFSRLGLVAFLMVALSGGLQAAVEVGDWGGLITTTYGQLVLVKIGLLVVMAVLAAVNTFVLRRTAFVRGVRAELVAGIVVLAVAAMLTGLVPSRNFLP